MSADQQAGVYVDRFYEMDPQFDDLITGADLREGMVVLIEEMLFRGDPSRAFGDDTSSRFELHKIREANRWCTVTNLRRTPEAHGHLVEFVGLYADGTKIPRRFAGSYHWLVKTASVQPAGGAS